MSQLPGSFAGVGAAGPSWRCRYPRLLRTLARLEPTWDDAQLLEAREIAGFYRGVSYMANVASVELEEWGVRFPGG